MPGEKLEGKSVDDLYDTIYEPDKPSKPEEVVSEKEEVDAEGTEPTSEKVAEPEADTEPSPIEEKLKKISELLGDDEEAIDAYIKQKGYHKDPAWRRQRELLEKYKSQPSALSDGDKALIEQVKQVAGSPEFIRSRMKSEGYKEETINSKLAELGHKVEESTVDDFTHVLKALDVDVSQLNDNDKGYVNTYLADAVKAAGILIDKRLKEAFPKEIGPLKDNLTALTREKMATEHTQSMESVVKAEGILDFEQDIAPKLYEFMEANPKAKQEEVLGHFEKINHELVIDRLKTGERKKVRDVNKVNNRPSERGGHTIDISKIKPISGDLSPNESSKEIGRLMDELGVG